MNLIKYRFILLFFLGVSLIYPFKAKTDEANDFNNKIYQNNIIKSYPFQERSSDIGLFYDIAWDKNNKKITHDGV